MVHGGARFQLSYGEEILGDRILLTGGTVTANAVTGLSTTLTDQKYEGQYMHMLTGTNAGKIFHIVTNTTNSITCEESLSGNATTDEVAFTLRNKDPTTMNKFIAVVEDFTPPDPEWDLQPQYTHGNGPNPSQHIHNKVTYHCTIPFIVQNFAFPSMAYCNIADVGTDVTSGGGSTLAEAVYAGQSVFDLAAGTNYTANDYIQIGEGALAEIKKISSVSTNTVTLTEPCKFDHTSGAACNEVTTPVTHTVTSTTLRSGDRPPYFTLQQVHDEATDFVRHASGGRINKLTWSSGPDGCLKAEAECFFMSQDKEGTKETVVVLTTDPYHYSDVSQGISINGVEYARMENFSYSIDNGLEEQYVHQDTTGMDPFESLPQKIVQEFTATMIATNTNFWDLCHDKTAFTTILKFARSATDYIQFTFSNCYIGKIGRTMSFGKATRAELTVSFQTCSIEVKDSIYYYTNG